MNIVLTGSLGNIGKPLTEALVHKGHAVTVISSHAGRQAAIEALGAKAAIGQMQDADFLASTFQEADLVYLMETMEAVGDMFDKSVDFIGAITHIGEQYKAAVERAGVKQVIHLSSIGAHTDKGVGILLFHHQVETILRQLPTDVAIKFIRPVGFYLNLFSFVRTIKSAGAIVSNYGGDTKEPWVSPLDIAAVIAEEVDKPFTGKTVRYVASDEVSPNEVARALGAAIGKPDLEWKVIPSEQLLARWLGIGFNEQVARGFVELQESQGNGTLYADYHQHQPVLGKVKIEDFAKDFAEAYHQE
jgi:uncharacterized protein YbjT (DUF2867 family)